MNGEQKITSSHRERLAVVYLRQSSMAQVREHTESTLSNITSNAANRIISTPPAIALPR